RARVGLRLRRDVELAGGLRRLPAPQDRGGRRAAADPHRARRRLRAARAMTLRRRLALVAAAAGAIAIVVASLVVYRVLRGELRGRVDDELRASGTRVPFIARIESASPQRPGGPPPVPVPPGAERLRLPRGTLALPPPRDALGLATAYVDVVGPDGTLVL